MIQILVTVLILAVSAFVVKKFVLDKPEKSSKQEETQEKKSSKKEAKKQQQQKSEEKKEPQVSIKQLQKQKYKGEKKKKIHHKHIDHPLYLNSCIQFADEITGFDYQGQYICISSKDKTLKIYDILTVNEKEMKNYYKQFQYDYPSAVAMSSDSSYLAVALHKHINIQVYSFNPKNEDKKYFNLMHEFPYDSHVEPISKMQIQLGNKYLSTFSNNKDTDIKIWDLWTKDLISKKHTGLLEHHHCYFSNTMLSVCGFASNCFVYKYKEDKIHHRDEEIKKIISLPHDKNMKFSSLSNEESRAFTVCADDCIRIWSLDVMYHLQEDAKLLKEFKLQDAKQLFKNPEQFETFTAIHGVYNENSKKWLIAIASNNSVVLLNNKYEKIEEISDIVAEGCQIDDIKIVTIKNAYALLVLSKLEERISIFKINQFLK